MSPREALQRGLQGKVLSLRNPIPGEKLAFNADGSVAGKAEHGVVSLDRDFVVETVDAKDDVVTLHGLRVNYVWSQKLKQLARSPQNLPIQVRLLLRTQDLTEPSIGQVLRKVFLTPNEMNAPCTQEEQKYFQDMMEKGEFGKPKKKEKKGNDEPEASAFPELIAVCMPSGERGYRVAKGVKPPKATETPDPSYSESARKAKVQGTAVYVVRVDEQGTVSDVLLQRQLEPTLNLKGARAISNWRFEPGSFHGKPVPVIIHVEVNFRLY